MKLVLINKFEAIEMLGKDWDKPVNSDRATVKGQLHKPFYVSDKWANRRKGITVTRKGFKGRKTYKAYPTTQEDLEKRFSRLMDIPENNVGSYLEQRGDQIYSDSLQYADPRNPRESLKRPRR